MDIVVGLGYIALDALEATTGSADEGEDEVIWTRSRVKTMPQLQRGMFQAPHFLSLGAQCHISTEAALLWIADVNIKGGWETGKPYAPYIAIIPNLTLIVSSVCICCY